MNYLKDKCMTILFVIVASIALVLMGCATTSTVLSDEAHIVKEYRQPGFLTSGYVLLRICNAKPPLGCTFVPLPNRPTIELAAEVASGVAGPVGMGLMIRDGLRGSGDTATINNQSSSTASSQSNSGSFVNIGGGHGH